MLRKTIIAFLFFSISSCVMDPSIELGKITNESATNIRAVLNYHKEIFSDSLFKDVWSYSVNSHSSISMTLPGIPDFPADHVWRFDVFNDDSVKKYYDSIRNKLPASNKLQAFKRYYIKSIPVTQKEMKKCELRILYDEESTKK